MNKIKLTKRTYIVIGISAILITPLLYLFWVLSLPWHEMEPILESWGSGFESGKNVLITMPFILFAFLSWVWSWAWIVLTVLLILFLIKKAVEFGVKDGLN